VLGHSNLHGVKIDFVSTVQKKRTTMTQQDTGKFRTNMKDQYYTNAGVAKECVERLLDFIPNARDYQWIEPSAGNGVFLKCLPESIEKVGIDIDPKGELILKGDFLQWHPTTKRPRIFFGNPPFGSQSSLVIKFIKHASHFADAIGFILPRSFLKPSMSRHFPPFFHCIYTEELPKYSFEVNGKRYNVPCIFQIWTKQETPRDIPEAVKEIGFAYKKPTESFDFVCKRVGGQAGRCFIDSTRIFNKKHDKDYNYFLELDSSLKAHTKEIIEQMNNHIFPSNTTGFRSLSKSEINEVLNPIVQQFVS
jgi:hypothetical protein